MIQRAATPSAATRRTDPKRGVLATAALIAFIAGCHQEGVYFIPPGSEAGVLKFIEPLRLGEPVVDGYHLENVEIDHTVVRLELQKAGAPTARVELLRRWSPTSEIEVRAAPETPPVITQAISQAVANGRSAVSPWVRKKLKLSDVAPLLVLMTMLALVLVTAVLLLTELRTAAPPGWASAWLLALIGVATVLRLAVSPRAFLHEYYHITESMTFMFDSTDGAQYGLTGPVLFRAADFLLGGQERAAFLANALAASLTIPAVVLFDLSLFQRWSRALLAGSLVCLLPVHLRFAGSEELWIVGILFTLWSLAAWARWLRSGGGWALATSALALALAMQSRSELLILPVAHVGLLLVISPPKAWLRPLFSWPFLLSLTALVALITPRLVTLARTRGMLPHTNFPTLASFRNSTMLIDSAITPSVLLLLAVAGIAYGLRQQRAITVWLVALAALYLVIPLAAFDNRPCIYRTQMFSVVLVAIAAAGAPMWLRRPAPGIAVAVLMMMGGLWSHRPFVTELLDQQQEFAWLERTIPSLPHEVEIVTPFMTGLDRMDDFPQFLLERNQNRAKIDEVGNSDAKDPWPQPKAGLLFYEGMYCHFSRTPPAPMRVTRICQDILDHYELRSLSVAQLETRGYSQMYYASAPFEIGFFEITGLRPPPQAHPAEVARP